MTTRAYINTNNHSQNKHIQGQFNTDIQRAQLHATNGRKVSWKFYFDVVACSSIDQVYEVSGVWHSCSYLAGIASDNF